MTSQVVSLPWTISSSSAHADCLAGVIAVLQLSASVLQLSYSYLTSVKGAAKEIRDLISELRGLDLVLADLESRVASEDADATGAGSTTVSLAMRAQLEDENGPLATCRRELERLKGKLEGPARPGNILIWPITKSEMKRSLDCLGRGKTTLSLLLTVDLS